MLDFTFVTMVELDFEHGTNRGLTQDRTLFTLCQSRVIAGSIFSVNVYKKIKPGHRHLDCHMTRG